MYFTTMNFRITPYHYDIPTHKQETTTLKFFILLKVCTQNKGFQVFTFDYDYLCKTTIPFAKLN